jgi:hypothetical protein
LRDVVFLFVLVVVDVLILVVVVLVVFFVRCLKLTGFCSSFFGLFCSLPDENVVRERVEDDLISGSDERKTSLFGEFRLFGVLFDQPVVREDSPPLEVRPVASDSFKNRLNGATVHSGAESRLASDSCISSDLVSPLDFPQKFCNFRSTYRRHS